MTKLTAEQLKDAENKVARKELLILIRVVIKEQKLETMATYSDKRKSNHNSNIYGRQMKFTFWESVTTMQKLAEAINEMFNKENLNFHSAVVKSKWHRSHPAVQVYRKS